LISCQKGVLDENSSEYARKMTYPEKRAAMTRTTKVMKVLILREEGISVVLI
jgi:hypothetical protein